MECRTALDWLELSQPGTGSPPEPELEEASAHLGDCPACRRTVARRRDSDVRIARAMLDVPLPAGLQQRLLEALAAAETVAAPPPPPPAAARRVSRRTWMATLLSTSAALLVAAMAWQFWGASAPTAYAMADIERLVTTDVDALEPFDGPYRPRRPGFGWGSDRLQWLPARGITPPGADRAQLAVLPFVYSRSDRDRIRGFLVMIPRDQVLDPPDESHMSVHDAPYRRPQGRFAATAWSEGDFVYFCYVEGGRTRLEALQDALDSAPVG